jgi:DNA-binding CsgD family transcriptional regulator
MTRGATTSRPTESVVGGHRAVAGQQAPRRLLTRRPRTLPGASKNRALSPRELEVLEQIARGATNAGIAAHFVLSEDTVKSHVKHILQKLGVGNRTEAALHFVEEHGLPNRNGGLKSTGTAEAAEHHLGLSELGAMSERRATVTGRLARDRVALRLDDGRAVEVPLLEPMFDRVERESLALVYLDRDGGTVGWYLPDAGLGVDMRGQRTKVEAKWSVSSTFRGS